MPSRILLIATVLSGCATTGIDPSVADEPLGWICQRSPSDMGGHLWVNKVLTAAKTHNGYSVGWRVFSQEKTNKGGVDLFWTVPPQSEWYTGLDHATFDFAFARQPAGPIYATLYLDDEAVQREQVFDRRSVRRFRKSMRWGGTLRLISGASSASRLYSARTASVIVTGPEDRQIARIVMPLPQWEVVDRSVRETIPALDRDALDPKGKCQRESGPEI